MLAQAQALGPFDPAARPLWGVPFAVKDNIDVAGMPTTAACAEYAYMPDKDATVVARLQGAGALVVGKTNLDQFATGLVGVRTPYPIPRNAVDRQLVPGGSSSGSAVATARGIVSFALGTDTAGSGRIPAGAQQHRRAEADRRRAFATRRRARLPHAGLCLGFRADRRDAYACLRCAAGQRCRRSLFTDRRGPPTRRAPAGAERRRAGQGRPEILRRQGDAGRLSRRRLLRWRARRAELVEIPFARFLRHRRIFSMKAPGWPNAMRRSATSWRRGRSGLHPVTRKIIGGARKLSAADAFNGLYALQAYKAKLAPVIASVDLFCVPTAPTHYTLEQVLADPIATNSRLGTYTNFVNLLECAASPCRPVRRRRRPADERDAARAGRAGTASLAALARDIHAASGLPLGATGWAQPGRPPPVGGIAGRHDRAGGRRRASVGHAAQRPAEGGSAHGSAGRQRRPLPIRLYALAGAVRAQAGPGPRRRTAAPAIEVEVWRLAADAFGRFVAAIPPPLGIGTIELEDGSRAKGFLVETAGLDGASDISSFGGWRRFVSRGKDMVDQNDQRQKWPLGVPI